MKYGIFRSIQVAFFLGLLGTLPLAAQAEERMPQGKVTIGEVSGQYDAATRTLALKVPVKNEENSSISGMTVLVELLRLEENEPAGYVPVTADYLPDRYNFLANEERVLEGSIVHPAGIRSGSYLVSLTARTVNGYPVATGLLDIELSGDGSLIEVRTDQSTVLAEASEAPAQAGIVVPAGAQATARLTVTNARIDATGPRIVLPHFTTYRTAKQPGIDAPTRTGDLITLEMAEVRTLELPLEVPDAPGSYLIEVVLKNQAGEQVSSAEPFRVVRAGPSAQILNLRSEVKQALFATSLTAHATIVGPADGTQYEGANLKLTAKRNRSGEVLGIQNQELEAIGPTPLEVTRVFSAGRHLLIPDDLLVQVEVLDQNGRSLTSTEVKVPVPETPLRQALPWLGLGLLVLVGIAIGGFLARRNKLRYLALPMILLGLGAVFSAAPPAKAATWNVTPQGKIECWQRFTASNYYTGQGPVSYRGFPLYDNSSYPTAYEGVAVAGLPAPTSIASCVEEKFGDPGPWVIDRIDDKFTRDPEAICRDTAFNVVYITNESDCAEWYENRTYQAWDGKTYTDPVRYCTKASSTMIAKYQSPNGYGCNFSTTPRVGWEFVVTGPTPPGPFSRPNRVEIRPDRKPRDLSIVQNPTSVTLADTVRSRTGSEIRLPIGNTYSTQVTYQALYTSAAYPVIDQNFVVKYEASLPGNPKTADEATASSCLIQTGETTQRTLGSFYRKIYTFRSQVIGESSVNEEFSVNIAYPETSKTDDCYYCEKVALEAKKVETTKVLCTGNGGVVNGDKIANENLTVTLNESKETDQQFSCTPGAVTTESNARKPYAWFGSGTTRSLQQVKSCDDLRDRVRADTGNQLTVERCQYVPVGENKNQPTGARFNVLARFTRQSAGTGSFFTGSSYPFLNLSNQPTIGDGVQSRNELGATLGTTYKNYAQSGKYVPFGLGEMVPFTVNGANINLRDGQCNQYTQGTSDASDATFAPGDAQAAPICSVAYCVAEPNATGVSLSCQYDLRVRFSLDVSCMTPNEVTTANTKPQAPSGGTTTPQEPGTTQPGTTTGSSTTGTTTEDSKALDPFTPDTIPTTNQSTPYNYGRGSVRPD